MNDGLDQEGALRTTAPLKIPVRDILPDAASVLRAQGVSGPARKKVADLGRQALALLESLASPAAVVEGVSLDEFMEVFRGEGLNESPNPIEKIFPFASGLALFAVTLGDKVRGKIDALFTTDDFALGCLLDTAASLAADRAAAWLEARCSAPSQRLRARPKGGALSGGRAPQEIRPLRYSPGYCGWHLSGQKKLFARLKPERIGLRLNESWLMSPLKSVSGVIVTAPASRHAVEPSYGFCASCRNRTCKTRSGTRPEGLGKEAA